MKNTTTVQHTIESRRNSSINMGKKNKAEWRNQREKVQKVTKWIDKLTIAKEKYKKNTSLQRISFS